MCSDEFYIYRKNLPHWREINATYFVTWRVHPEQRELSPEERDLVVATLRYFENERYELYVFVVMNDHVHVILRTFKDHQLERLLQSLKSYSANQLHKYFGRTGKIWQAESFDRIVRNEEEYYQKAKYIYDNPFNRWPEIKEYMWYGIGKQSINSCSASVEIGLSLALI